MDQESEGTSLVIFVVGGAVLLLLLLGGGVAFFFLASSEVIHEMPFVDEPPMGRVDEADAPVPDDVPQDREKVEKFPVQQPKDHNPEQPAPPPAPK